MTCRRPYCNETVLLWLDPDYCGTGCRAAAINAREQQIRGLEAEFAVDQADVVWADIRTLAASATEDLDQAGGRWRL